MPNPFFILIILCIPNLFPNLHETKKVLDKETGILEN